MDPTLLAVLSIFGGAALTAAAGFFGAWLQSRREHVKWIRERRYDAYVEMVTLHNEIEAAEMVMAQVRPGAPDENRVRALAALEALAKRFPSAVVPLAILGPAKVNDAATEYMAASNRGDVEARRAADEKLLRAMRAALKI